jgi:hypothetical protein
MIVHFTVNGSPVEADAPPETPLLWVLRQGNCLAHALAAEPDYAAPAWCISTAIERSPAKPSFPASRVGR